MAVTAVRGRPNRLREWSGHVGWAVLAWVVAIAFFLPVLWMVITAFKPESAAETWPPRFVFKPTTSEFHAAFANIGPYLTHPVLARRDVLLHLHQDAADRGRDRAAVRHRRPHSHTRHPVAADHPLHRDEP